MTSPITNEMLEASAIGYAAYRPVADITNPYDHETQRELFYSWRTGFNLAEKERFAKKSRTRPKYLL